MEIRAAGPDDRDDLLVWRNDPLSRSMFINQAEVTATDHARWFQRVLADPDRALFIGEMDGVKVGVCRFDRDRKAGAAEVSINLNPVMRGRGLARPLLAGAIAHYRQGVNCRLTAVVRAANPASRRVFEGCGFAPAGQSDGLIHYRLDAGPG